MLCAAHVLLLIMSRNKEKALSGLNRHYQQKLSESAHIDVHDRPTRVLSVSLLREAEAYRRAVLGEFLSKLSDINNPMIGDDDIRILNEKLRKLDREKAAWEHHILLLGGPDYLRQGHRIGTNVDGQWYYGRAKELLETKKKKKLASGPRADIVFSDQYYGLRARVGSKPGPFGSLRSISNCVLPDNSPNSPGASSMPRVLDLYAPVTKEELLRILHSKKVLENEGQKIYTNKDVEKWLVERKKKELLLQINNQM